LCVFLPCPRKRVTFCAECSAARKTKHFKNGLGVQVLKAASEKRYVVADIPDMRRSRAALCYRIGFCSESLDLKVDSAEKDRKFERDSDNRSQAERES